jgi:DNA-binding SARP family transcriptional activator
LPSRRFSRAPRRTRTRWLAARGCGRYNRVLSELQFRILGPLEVAADGGRIELGGSKQRALLADLALHPNEVLSRDRLIDDLWGERPPETASSALHVYVSRLRKLLPDVALETRPPGYVLAVDPERIDVHRFERLLADGRAALQQGDAAAAAALLRDALSLWRGMPLADVAYEPFADREIHRLQELRLAALEERIEADLALGRTADLVGELERLIAEHPLRERLRRQLMLALYRSGRQAEALDAYQHARRALVAELGIEPTRAVQELERAILRQDPALEPPVPPALPEEPEAPSDPRLAVFVGRERELAELEAALAQALAGRGRVVLLAGEPGIGKTRLADELATRAKAGGATVLVGRCWEAGGAPAYWPWVQSLRAFLRESPAEEVDAVVRRSGSELVYLLPELREIFPELPEPPPLESEGARFRLFDATASFLRGASAVRPLVLVLDDLQAADASSLLLLQFVTTQLGDAHVLVLGTYRDTDVEDDPALAAAIADVARQGARRLRLRGLREPEVARYIELITGDQPPAAVVAKIWGDTEGNPLFVGEVVRLLAAEGTLASPDAKWPVAIPQGVREVISRRLRRLSSECTNVLALASVLGREFSVDALQRVSGLPVADLLDLLDEAMAARLVTEVPGGLGRLRFGHALISDTLYEQLTTARRMKLHATAGEALEKMYERDLDPHLAELARHFFAAAPAGTAEKALRYARSAAERAVQLLAFEEAVRLYEMALRALALARPGDNDVRNELSVALDEARARARDAPRA